MWTVPSAKFCEAGKLLGLSRWPVILEHHGVLELCFSDSFSSHLVSIRFRDLRCFTWTAEPSMSGGSVMGQILTAQSTHPQDPYFYFPRVSSIAKFVINAGNDDFFVPDNTKEWWQAVPGPKWSLALAISRHLWLLHFFLASCSPGWRGPCAKGKVHPCFQC